MFGGPREEFAANLKQYGIVPTLLDSDFRAVDYSKMPLYNVFFYDGPHAEKDNYQAMRLVAAALDDEYVLIVDDWNWESVRNGVFSGLKDSGQRILSAIEVRTVNRVNPLDAQHGDWHNGYLIAVVRKNADTLRPCTCHPDEAPVPCPHKYAFGECVKAAALAEAAE
jgi:hypothetical protein